MAKEKKFLLIEEETLREMLQTRFNQSYALVLLSYICLKHNLDMSLTMAEINGVLQLSNRQVEEARKRCQIRFLGIGGGRLYSAYDIVMLAARLHRKRAMTPLREIPRYVCNPQLEKQTAEEMHAGLDMLQGLTDQR